ncbi:MAG: GIY-YIG nuclease family protein [Candidatus Moraniibacteriota bacterium]
MSYAYILRSEKNSSYYVGSCEDVTSRLTQHNNGRVKSTKRYRPWLLVYQERLGTLEEARRREKQIKGWKKRVAIERLLDISKK